VKSPSWSPFLPSENKEKKMKQQYLNNLIEESCCLFTMIKSDIRAAGLAALANAIHRRF